LVTFPQHVDVFKYASLGRLVVI